MKKLKLMMIAVVSFSALSAFGDTNVTCVDRTLQDSVFSTTFKLSASNSKVDLFVPSGETSGDIYSAECHGDKDAIELAITCNVMTSTDSGYEVRLYSIGGPTLHASVTPWSMAGNGNPA